MKYALAIFLCLALSACSLLPSGFRVFGTPLERNSKAEAKDQAARADAVKGAQGSIYKAKVALSHAPDSLEVRVAQDYANEASGLLDQSAGAPPLEIRTEWEREASALISDNEVERRAGLRARELSRNVNADISGRLAAAELEKERLQNLANEYAAENESWADLSKKVFWGAIALSAFWVVSQVAAFASHFIPSAAPVANLLGMVSGVGQNYVINQLRSGVAMVGKAVGDMRAGAEHIAEEATSYLDAHTHSAPQVQALISEAAARSLNSQKS